MRGAGVDKAGVRETKTRLRHPEGQGAISGRRDRCIEMKRSSGGLTSSGLALARASKHYGLGHPVIMQTYCVLIWSGMAFLDEPHPLYIGPLPAMCDVIDPGRHD